MIVEGAMFVAGIALYLSATRARDRTGTYAFWGLIAFLVLTNVGNMFGPPPPSAVVVAWSAQALWLLVAWGYWIDRHRTAA
jgi:lipopolysaccharide export LptBFGC system permease protein LptF